MPILDWTKNPVAPNVATKVAPTKVAPKVSDWSAPVLNKFGTDISTHPFNPLNPRNQINQPEVQPKYNAFEKVGAFVDKNMPGTTQVLEDIKQDPFAIKRDPYTYLFPDVWKALKDPIMQAGDKIAELFNPELGKDPLSAARVGATMNAVAAVGGALLSPITALFQGAKDIPILGTAVRTLIDIPFSAAGDVGTGSANAFVNKLPISPKAKEQIKPGLEAIAALTAQLVLGKAGLDAKAYDALKAKFGPVDAETIARKAQELAAQKQAQAPVAPKTAPTEAITGREALVQEAKNQGYEVKFIDKVPKDYNAKHFPDSKTIEVYTKGRTPEQIASSLNHEIGHTVDYNRRGIVADPMGDSIKGFDGKLRPAADGDIYVRDMTRHGDELKAIRAELPRKDGVANTQKEIFADAYRLYKENPARLKEIAPNVSADLEKFLTKPIESPLLQEAKKYKKETGTVAKASSDINESLVKKGFDSIPESEQAKYTPTTKAEQIAKITDFMSKNLEEAKGAAKGEMPIPNGILPQPLFNAMEEYATQHNDVQLLRDLAKSPIATQLSEAGQALGSHGFNDNPNSAVAAIREVAKARETKTKGKVKETTEGIKKEINKGHTKETWSSFVDSLKC